MIVDKNKPIITVRFVPVSEETVWGTTKAYIFKCRASSNTEKGTIDIDIVFENKREEAEFEEFKQSKENGVEYFSEILELRD
jgi:hypothetical protein